METGKVSERREVLKLLVVGNNPIELSKVRLSNFKPDFILIDDNIGKTELRQVVDQLLRERRTKHIPITVLKNSNYREAIGNGVYDYILKENLSTESIYRAIMNSFKIRKTQQYLYQSYKKRKGQLMRLFRNEPAFQI